LIQYLKHKDIDKAKWDACITNSVNGMIYAYSWYLDIVSPGWEGLVEDDYKSVMPLPMGEKYGFRYTYPPPYIQQLGLFSTSAIAETDVAGFLFNIPAQYKYIEMNLNERNQFNPAGFKIIKGLTHLLNLTQAYKNILANYSTQTKRNLKKAQVGLLTITKDVAPNQIIELFKTNKGKQYSHNSTHYSILEKLMQACIKKGVGQSWGVYTSENALCAGAFFLQNNGRAIFLFSGANSKAYETHAMTFLINKFIEEHAEQNLIFDFEGSLDPDLARFYKGFGSTETSYLQIRKNTLPLPVKLLKELQYKRKVSSSR
jgi:hypothetical protein